MSGELVVGHNVDAVDATDGREVVEDVFDHWLAGDGEQRFGLRESKRIKTGGVAGRKNNDFHSYFSIQVNSNDAVKINRGNRKCQKEFLIRLSEFFSEAAI